MNTVTLKEERRKQFAALIEEFASTFAVSPEGKDHAAAYAEMRRTAKSNWDELVSAADRGEDITDRVLLKLLPYEDSEGNRRRGAWICIAPAIQGNIREWFENSDWARAKDWPSIAQAIFRFVRRCVEHPEELEAACREFITSGSSRGFQTGMLTPILNALRPEDFVLLNSKSRAVLEYLTGMPVTSDLNAYPRSNELAKRVIRELNPELTRAGLPNLLPGDVFDMFAHWFVAIKKYDFAVQRSSEPRKGSERVSDSSSGSAFSAQTFELLDQLYKNPTRAYYNAHKQELKIYVMQPLQELLRAVAARLPETMTSRLETKKDLFSRIPKNDRGRGGVNPYYWGAFYAKGGSRRKLAQLYVSLTHKNLYAGFYAGSSTERQKFNSSCKRHRDVLMKLLGDSLKDRDIIWGGLPDYFVADGTAPLAELTFAEWLAGPARGNWGSYIRMPLDEVLRLSRAELAERIADLFRRLFPLVLLETETDPVPAITEYLGLSPQSPDQEVVREPEMYPATARAYSLEQCSADSGFGPDELVRWVRAIQRKKQAIIYGPPGTGKTYLARLLAKHLVGGSDGFSDIVQFHPAYAYEDFIQGIRPCSVDGKLNYPLVRGRFLEFCAKARERKGICVLIIDEINRANLARVFGELMYLLEYRDEDIPLAGGERFSIPGNVRLIGTMNTADRTIALVDHALRRRFAFIPLYPNYEVLRHYHRKTGINVEGLITKLEDLNREIGDNHYAVGISFFLRENLRDEIKDIWQMEIEPYLEEYFFDRRESVDRFRWENVKEEIGF